jgi:serine/threonine protein kinase
MLKKYLIGEGSYGQIFYAKSTNKDERFAVKRNLVDTELDFAVSIRELDILTKFQDHPHIVRIEFMSVGDPFTGSKPMSPLKKPGYKDDKIHFIFPLAAGDLMDIIENEEYKYVDIIKYMTHILLAIEYMHGKSIIHRDIKPGNVLNFDGCMQLCDFGLSKPFATVGPNSTNVVTSCYRPPEVALEIEKYDYKVDVWSAGCILYELITRKSFINTNKDDNKLLLDKILEFLPYEVSIETINRMKNRSSNKAIKRRVIKHKERNGKPRKSWKELLFRKIEPKGIDIDFTVDLISKMMQFDPDLRCTATEALDHPFFDSMREYINEVRSDFLPEPDPYPKIKVVKCNERMWGMNVAFEMFNMRGDYEWYNHRVLFQAIDIFDRYLIYLEQNQQQSKENSTHGLFLSKYRARLSFLVCLYISIKYFVGMTYPISFSEITTTNYKTDKAMKIADEFETHLIKEVLAYNIYRPTVYDIATSDFNEYKVIDLLRVVAAAYRLDEGLSILEVLEAFEDTVKDKYQQKKTKNQKKKEIRKNGKETEGFVNS